MAKGSLAVRAGFAVTVMVMFYAFAAAAIAALGYATALLFHFMTAPGGKASIMILLLALVCAGAALVILWSVLPRWDKFEPPGAEVTAAEHPELFAEIRRIAEATGQHEPAHVYLVPDVNAFVAQRGGIMGIGSSRVMGIGLPLMRTLQVDEMRAVLAHEMGHFYGGDTKLGPWIYKTRGALGRTVMNLTRAGAHAEQVDWVGYVFRAVRAPFHWFLLGFMRISQAISRAQEYSADAVAVRAEGQRALIDGLKKTHAAALAHSLYMRNEVVPLVEQGKLPEVGRGFSQFLSSKHMSELLEKVVDHELAEGHKDPYDSHPPLRERIEAAAQIDGPTREPDPRSAIELVRDAEGLEARDLESRVTIQLERIKWEDTAAVWEKMWRTDVEASRQTLSGITAESFPVGTRAIYELATRELRPEILQAIDDGMLRGWWANFVGTALAVKLLDAGFVLKAAPGAPFLFVRDGEEVTLFAEVGKRIEEKTSDEEWKARCASLGIAGTLA